MLCFLGLIPAVAFYVCGYVLSGLLVLGSALCELILRQSFRCVVLIISSLLSWITRSASNVSLTRETYRSIRRSFWYAYVVFIAFCCLLIRSAARSLIRAQDCYGRWIIALRLLIIKGSASCEMILAQCIRCIILIMNSLVTWISPSASDPSSIRCLMSSGRFALSKLYGLNQKTYRSIRRGCLYVYVTFIKFCCLLIRSAARSLIRLEDCFMWLDRGASPFEHKGRAFAGIWLRLVWWQFYLVIFGETLRLAA